MRHGRTLRRQRFNGFKRHIAIDGDRGVILACAITPTNRPEEEATPSLTTDLARQGLDVDQRLIDRGYINSTLVEDVRRRRGQIVCTPWTSHNGGQFPTSAFRLNLRDRTIECPAGQVQHLSLGTVVAFDSEVCDRCSVRSQCPTAEIGHGRSVAMAENEPLQHDSAGRSRRPRDARPCGRTTIEHTLAHISPRQGHDARDVWVRKNTCDLRRASATQHLETLHLAEVQSGQVA